MQQTKRARAKSGRTRKSLSEMKPLMASSIAAMATAMHSYHRLRQYQRRLPKEGMAATVGKRKVVTARSSAEGAAASANQSARSAQAGGGPWEVATACV